jgi:hypothetical protein
VKIQAYVDSGANIHSKKKFTVEIDQEDWDEMAPDERENYMRDAMLQEISWGYDEPEAAAE